MVLAMPNTSPALTNEESYELVDEVSTAFVFFMNFEFIYCIEGVFNGKKSDFIYFCGFVYFI
jgi:hypothetical protein